MHNFFYDLIITYPSTHTLISRVREIVKEVVIECYLQDLHASGLCIGSGTTVSKLGS